MCVESLRLYDSIKADTAPNLQTNPATIQDKLNWFEMAVAQKTGTKMEP